MNKINGRIFHEETIEDFWGRNDYVILDENNHEADYNSFHEGDVLILENMPYDLWDENSWSFIHATGRAIWSSTRYPSGGWVTEYED